jgi:carboxyl-terminal processing protease
LKIAFKPALCGLFFWCIGCVAPTVHADNDTLADFDFLWDTVAREYAYPEPARWQCVRERLRPQAQRATRETLLPILENAIESLTDFHAHLNANNERSWRLIPSGTDVRAQLENGRAIVEAVRARSSAQHAGVRVGDEVISVANVPTAQVLATHLAQFPCVDANAATSQHWALQRVLAGTHTAGRALTLKRADGTQRTVWLPAARVDNAKPPLKRLSDGTVVITLTELGDRETVKRFHAQLRRAMNSTALILDLRETANGGNTSVAEPILARFVRGEQPYQRVLPRNASAYARTVQGEANLPVFDKPIAVVVGPWTASMGEGMAIGLNATRQAPVVGAPMAGLRGAVESFTLPHSGWRFSIPTAQLAHLNGTAREAFMPIPADRNVYGTALIYEAARRAMHNVRAK